MALAATNLYELRNTATAGNLNGGGFNPGNANFFTDFTATSADTAAPVISSASYAFVAGDQDAYAYVKAGTNWRAGFYRIASVSGGNATLDATLGTGMYFDAGMNRWLPTTWTGCASTASPTGGTLGFAFMFQDAAEATMTDLASVGASTTLTSAAAPFRAIFVGNILSLNTTGTGAFGVVGRYEIVSYTNATTVVTDRTTNTGTALVAGQGRIGGAVPLGTTGTLSDDSFFERDGVAGNRYFFRSGTYTPFALAIAVGGTVSAPQFWTGYKTVWGDVCNDSDRPVLAMAANGLTAPVQVQIRNIIFTTTAANGITAALGDIWENCSFINTSTTTGRAAFGTSTGSLINCEFISYRGSALVLTGASFIMGCIIRNSDIGVRTTTSGSGHVRIDDCIIENCRSFGFQVGSAFTGAIYINRCTFVGTLDTTGVAIDIPTGKSAIYISENIIWGWATGIQAVDSVANSLSYGNNFYNNDTDVTVWQKMKSDMAIDPAFTNEGQITGATATTSGSVLTQSGADFSTVTDNVDFCYLVSGTGITVGFYKITGHTTTTLTFDIAPGTSATADKVFSVVTGHNLMPTGAI